MNGAIEYFKAVTAPKREQTDRMDEEGYVVCGICGERKQQEIRVPESIHPSGRWRVPTACRCERMRAEAYERRIVKQEGIAHQKKLFLWSELPRGAHTFSEDDQTQRKESAVCQKYAAQFAEMEKRNIGMMLYGGVGTGKTFLAECIGRALCEQSKRVYFLRATDLLSDIKSIPEILYKAARSDLLMIDDFGAQRDSKYASEVMHSVLEQRRKVKKPLLLTTNLSPETMRRETDLDKKRLYDRILEMCPVCLYIKGDSRRREIAEEKKREAQRLLL